MAGVTSSEFEGPEVPQAARRAPRADAPTGPVWPLSGCISTERDGRHVKPSVSTPEAGVSGRSCHLGGGTLGATCPFLCGS